MGESKLSSEDFTNVIDILESIRQLLLKIAAFVSITFTISLFFSGRIIYLLQRNLKKPLIFYNPSEAFIAHLKVSLLSAIILSFPIISFGGARILSKRLFPGKRWVFFAITIFSTLLFISGLSLCHFFVLPLGINFLLSYETQYLKPMISVGRYISFCSTMLLSFGFMFELPLISLILSRAGIITSKTLNKFRRWAIVIIFIFSAVITPTTDAYTMTLLAVPLCILYEASIWISKIFEKKL